ncbi:MAG TPA: glycoside hydrolase family 13 protein [Halanaerobiales bacterium]|nr:glycoside hydrolase family 13 protein [Halanaerobiales bacterium]
MIKSAIEHKSYSNYAFPIDENTLKLRIKAAKNDIKSVKVIYGTRFVFDGREPLKVKEMKLKTSSEVNDFFETTIELEDPRFRYHFLLDDGENKRWYNEKGFSKNRPRGGKSGFFQYSLISNDDLLDRPDWLDEAVVYQIFPERFNNGNSDLDPANLKNWGDLPKRDSFFGGDLQGIYDKLDYLKDLGVNTIYLTPIFESLSNHKYNIDDYLKIDEHFGDEEIFEKLVNKAHDKDMKIILDAVFNHSGFNFFAFEDLRKRGENSKYKDWYIYDSLPLQTEIPVNYETFARNIPNLPKLDTANKEVQDYLLKVTEYWMKNFDIDGWRLDVADEVDSSFWRRFRKKVKSLDKDAYIIGEVWHSGMKWLQGNQFDAIMNYSFTEAVIDFIARDKIGPSEFDNRLALNRMNYREDITNSLLNLLDSHDTPRILRHCNEDKDKMKLAVLFQMTYPGVPMVLYGDELGLTGGDDPDSRRCMPWDDDKADYDLRAYYKKLIKIRKNNKILQKGEFESFVINEAKNIYSFKRKLEDREVIVIINNNPEKREICLRSQNKNYIDLLTNKNYKNNDEKIKLVMKPYQGMILE